MSVIDRLAASLGYVKAVQGEVPAFLRASAIAESWSQPDYSLPRNQAKAYQVSTWVQIAINLTATYAAGAALNVLSAKGEDTEDIENHPFEELLKRPNPLQSRSEFLEATAAFYKLTGNAYWWLNAVSASAPPAEIFVIPPYRMRPVPGGQVGVIDHFDYDVGNGRIEPIDAAEVVHFKKFHPLSMLVGLSPIEALAVDLEGDQAMASWNTNFFAKEHAKLPGALTFDEMVPDPVWNEMKADLKNRFGGTTRGLLMLRGAAGVKWLNIGTIQKDMEFLAARNFNKEEIFALYAPGLSSMLAINATEANSVTGKATFMEAAIWPLHIALAEKMTNDLLPRYGDGLTCEFEDVRLSDTAMELEEQRVAWNTMTVEEIRKKHWNLEPLGDERDKMLVVEVVSGKPATTPTQAEEEANRPQQLPPFLMGPGTNGHGQNGQEPAPPPPPNGSQPTREVEGQVREAQPTKAQQVRDELRAWERFALKRIGKTTREFETELVPPALKAAIDGALETASTPEAMRAVFDNAVTWQGYP